MPTPYHAKYLAYELTRRLPADKAEKLSQSLCNATVDLNPHQVDAALFAFRSPLSRGAILADEVGLGKTIEAGIILSQLWAERKRRILCIVPASLRKQWNRELADKFYMPSTILESKGFNLACKQGKANPFDLGEMVVIVSYQFASAKMLDVHSIPWDLVVIDEAHRLRNVYKKGNKIARSLRNAIGSRPKILLTATPLQNSLMELYGLVSFIDDKIFGDEESFRDQFAKRSDLLPEDNFNALKERIRPVCQRTLRRQVVEYVPYTARRSITQDFTPTPDEQRLYEQVSGYLQKPDLLALPSGQRQLITLVLRKILASSSFAIGATLGAMIERLEGMRDADEEKTLEEHIGDLIRRDADHAEELEDEWSESADVAEDQPTAAATKPSHAAAIGSEIDELKSYCKLAQSIQKNAKGDALLLALKSAFKKAEELGAPRKALIFTESRRTQLYLLQLLEQNGYAGTIVLFNGTNSDAASREIFKAWLKLHAGQDLISGSPSSDMRSALVEEFRDKASIMIATESAAEGVNLQFCSLVVNYDLPWNPQRIEQRIGRCHRYGQKFDVVVVNFLNRENQADRRVFELLDQKFKLFDGVFGASDEVLGALDTGADFEKRINTIHQTCRTSAEINAAFDNLQRELEEQIAGGLSDARTKLLENFDDDVHRKLRLRKNETDAHLSRYAELLWALTRIELAGSADFDKNGHCFQLRQSPDGLPADSSPLGSYRLLLDKDADADVHYRAGHPLAAHLIQRAKARQLPSREIVFDYARHGAQIALVRQLCGQAGWLRLVQISVSALESEDHLSFAGIGDDGMVLDAETCVKLLSVPATVGSEIVIGPDADQELHNEIAAARKSVLAEAMNRNQKYFDAEMAKLDQWAEDLKNSLERQIKDLDVQLKVPPRAAAKARPGDKSRIAEDRADAGKAAQRQTKEPVRVARRNRRQEGSVPGWHGREPEATGYGERGLHDPLAGCVEGISYPEFPDNCAGVRLVAKSATTALRPNKQTEIKGSRGPTMTENQQKEQFSIAYVRAVAAAARVNIYGVEVDDDSIDIGFSVKSVAGRPQSPMLNAQLKCATKLVGNARRFRYPLKAKNYNELVGGHYVPRILIVVVIPPELKNWLAQSENGLLLRRCGYWVSLRESPPSENKRNVTVEIPRTQIFSAVALRSMLKEAS